MRRLLSFILALVAVSAAVVSACTSAIVAPGATARGRILLWKHRDSGHLDNFVERVDAAAPGLHAYVALFNGGDSLLLEAWAGVNDVAFGIINTASYNLSPDTAVVRDREGLLMSRALAVCGSLVDFEVLLDTLPRPLGVQANFGVIDSTGCGAYYETCDTGYVKFALEEADGALVRTNFSVSGAHDSGLGYIRYDNACALLEPRLKRRDIVAQTFTDTLSRSFYHSLMGRDPVASDTSLRWLVDQDFIPRHSTSATVVIEGRSPGEGPLMWVALGYPPCAVTMQATVGSVPEPLRPDRRTWRSPACDASLERKARVFPITRGNGPKYIDVYELRKELQR